jgi:hypothetical protein
MVNKIVLNGLQGVNLVQGGDPDFECILKSTAEDGQELNLAYRPSSRKELGDLIKYLTDMSMQLYWSAKEMGK